VGAAGGAGSGSLTSLRHGNRRRIIDALRERGIASRAELARITSLSRSTVSTIVADLLEARLATERENGAPEPKEAQTGRPPVMISLDEAWVKTANDERR
jgi:DNA-binding transcriptional ArsR family regulator